MTFTGSLIFPATKREHSKVRLLMIGSIGPLKNSEVWMLHRICLIAGIVSTLMLMTPAVANDYGVQGHRGQRYGHVHVHRNYVRRGGRGLFGCRHWSPIGWYWTCYFW
jgi:hypothetical protein